jgi:hypothetical protein
MTAVLPILPTGAVRGLRSGEIAWSEELGEAGPTVDIEA